MNAERMKLPVSVSDMSIEVLLTKVDRGVADITRIKPPIESMRFKLRSLTLIGTDRERVM